MSGAGEIASAQHARAEAVLQRTGRTWADWFARLEAWGATAWDHNRLVEHLERDLDTTAAGIWWAPLIARAYEQAHGQRSSEAGAGSETTPIRKSRTLNAPPAALFDAWNDPEQRGRWLGAEGRDAALVRGSLSRGIQLAWPGALGVVEVLLLAKGFGKTQVTVQHTQLPDCETRAAFDRFWSVALEQLHRFLGNTL